MGRPVRTSPGRGRRARQSPGFARFFTKQLLLFAALALLIVVVDFFLYAVIAYRESDANFNDGTPASTVRAVDGALALQEDGTWTLGDAGAEALARQGAWALVIGEDGAVAWSEGKPDDVPDAFSVNDVAMAAHYASIADYPTFIWDRDDGLLAVGFPKREFWTMTLTYPASTVRSFPLYVLLIFAVDLGILCTIYAVSRRRTQNAVAPITSALDALSEGRAAELHLKGDLRGIGDQITETSAIIQQKDAARANWIRGISHDIRTPLSMILGYADALAQDAGADEEAREHARVIRAQGLKIKDLVYDLNTASRLDYDMQPLNLERVHAARLLRAVAAAHANSGLDERHPVELDIAQDALDATVLGDERLLTRAVENALANARVHNEGGCAIRMSLTTHGAWCAIRVSDDGAGLAPAELAALEARLARSRTAKSAAGSNDRDHGLGLVLIDRIARAHGGSISLDGAEGAGFAVTVTLPLA